MGSTTTPFPHPRTGNAQTVGRTPFASAFHISLASPSTKFLHKKGSHPATIHHVIRIPSASLATSPHLPALVALINDAFVTSWALIPGIVGPGHSRYESDHQFVEEMGTEGVTFAAFDEGGSILTTAGYKPWNAVWKVADRMKGEVERETQREAVQQAIKEDIADEDAGLEKFEVVAVAVDPGLQKAGLASRVTGMVEQELVERTRTAGRKRVKLMVRTGKEHNEVYWTKKGYRTVGEMRFSVGDFGSLTGFTALDMERVVEV